MNAAISEKTFAKVPMGSAVGTSSEECWQIHKAVKADGGYESGML